MIYKQYLELIFYMENITLKYPKYERDGLVFRIKNITYDGIRDIIYANKEFNKGKRVIILNNLENTNAEMISHNIPQRERLVNLNESARRQMRVLKDNRGIKDLELLQQQINKEEKILIENK